MALSTTHVATGSILGTGLGKKGAAVRWGVAGRMVVAWVITLPAAGLVGAACWALAHVIGGGVGIGVVFAILVAAAALMFRRSQQHRDQLGQRQRRMAGRSGPGRAARPASPSAPEPQGI